MSKNVGLWMVAAALAAGCSHRAVKEDEVQHITEFRMSREDVIEAVYAIMREREPGRFGSLS